MADILGVSHKEITPKMQTFAREIAKGSKKVDAYRKAYKADAKPSSLAKDPYTLANDPRVIQEVEAYRLALESAKHRTPVALRELVIQSLVQVLIDPKAKQATKVQASKVLGTVTEVSAFTERKEIRTISSSADTKAQIMAQLREMLNGRAEDATIIEADTLLRELSGETHPLPTPPDGVAESQDPIHTIPPEPTQQDSVLEDPPPPEKVSGAAPTHPFRGDTPA
jgi:hypothetical protein